MKGVSDAYGLGSNRLLRINLTRKTQLNSVLNSSQLSKERTQFDVFGNKRSEGRRKTQKKKMGFINLKASHALF